MLPICQHIKTGRLSRCRAQCDHQDANSRTGRYRMRTIPRPLFSSLPLNLGLDPSPATVKWVEVQEEDRCSMERGQCTQCVKLRQPAALSSGEQPGRWV